MITTMTQKGQVTIPVSIRKKLGMKSGQKVWFSESNGEGKFKAIPHWTSLMGSVKSNRRFSQKLLREEEGAIGKQIVKEYLVKEKRIREQENNG